MGKELELEIREQLIRYLAAGTASLREFRDWFDAATWDIEEQAISQFTSGLAAEIELRLAEYANGHLSEEELRAQLRPLVRASQIDWALTASEPRKHTSSSNSNVIALSGHGPLRISHAIWPPTLSQPLIYQSEGNPSK
jgi:hypothetical protein